MSGEHKKEKERKKRERKIRKERNREEREKNKDIHYFQGDKRIDRDRLRRFEQPKAQQIFVKNTSYSNRLKSLPTKKLKKKKKKKILKT